MVEARSLTENVDQDPEEVLTLQSTTNQTTTYNRLPHVRGTP